MFDWLHRLILPAENPDVVQSIVVIMLVIAAGVFVGRLKLGKISFGVSAVMFVGLLFGHWGYRIQGEILDFIRDLGLILFVYGIGIQVGPSFFSSFRKEGLRLNILAVSTVILGGVITFLLYKSTGLGIENLVGIMSGAVTNTPGLGAAKSTLAEIQNQFPTKMFDDPAIGYAITYPLGVFGIIGIIIFSKIILKVNPELELRKFRLLKINREFPPVYKKCRITNPSVIGKSLGDVIKESGHEVVISRIKHSQSDTVFSPSLDKILRENDVIMVVGLDPDVNGFIEKTGRISKDLLIESDKDIQYTNIYVTNKKATHKKLSELDLYTNFDLKVTQVFRASKAMLARPSLELFYGDILRVVGTEEAINEAKKVIGNSEKKLLEPDFLSIFGGLVLGIILGSIPIMIPSLPVPIKLGFAAGPLIVALLISRFGGISFIHSYVNTGAIYFMKDLGICLFFAAVGVHAGEKFYANFIEYNGWLWILYGSAITFIPLIIMILIAKIFMKLNFLQLSGLMSGTYTDPAALSFSTSYLDSDIPIQTYATVYPLVTITRIFVAQMLILLLA
ncbi:putative transporter [Lutibacter sp.]|uniref:putative transporter n=1 Tax=Lutibacter sp. TaxID=1925666 RepID=UPI002734F498|nr:putative transporter [Lutibacter sp.]MDP3312875.1 putative transporter [Lutibacter sp.]